MQAVRGAFKSAESEALEANRRSRENDAYFDSVGTVVQLATSYKVAYAMAGRAISTVAAPALAASLACGEFLATLVTRVLYGSALDQLSDSDGTADAVVTQVKRNFVQLAIILPVAFMAGAVGQAITGAPVAWLETLVVIGVSFVAVRIATLVMIALAALTTTIVEAI